jgi:CheY-like chemotaxis protein
MASDARRLEGVRLLLVDDDPDTRDIIERVLARRGADVVAVPSAAAALQAVEDSRFDVLLVDVMMPGMDGYDLMRKIRALPAEKNGRVPAATITARSVLEDRLESLRAGFQSHLAKPIEPDELVELVQALVGADRSAR